MHLAGSQPTLPAIDDATHPVHPVTIAGRLAPVHPWPAVTPGEQSRGDLTRRALVRGAGVVGAGWVLASCGPSDGRTGTDTATRSFAHPGGTTQVPLDPGRIVALHDLDVTLLLTITALRPDLIIGTLLSHQDLLARLDAIAPTVLVDQVGAADVFAVAEMLADLTGTTDQITVLRGAYEERVTVLAAGPLRFLDDRTYIYMEYGTEVYVSNRALTPGERVLTDLGLRPADGLSALPEGEFTLVSLELLPDLDADVIIIGTPSGETLDPQVRNLLGTTTAARRDAVLTVDYVVWDFKVPTAPDLVLDDVLAAAPRLEG